MGKLGGEIKTDLDFLRTHTLQPKWYKILKVFILAGILLGYYFLFGWAKTLLFFACFVGFSLIIHFTYRLKTKKYTRDWLDFHVDPQGNNQVPKFGTYYYPAILISAIISFITSQTLIP
jgi:hypothetical protein